MRTETTTRDLFTFNELSDEAKGRAIQACQNWNVDMRWWDCIYEDAANVGLEITSFDLDNSQEITGKLTMDIDESIARILTDHGSICDTHALASEYQAKLDPIQEIIDSDTDAYDTDTGYGATDKADADIRDLEIEYERALLKEYLVMLRKEHEYLTSEEAIVVTILANNHEFTADGEIA